MAIHGLRRSRRFLTDGENTEGSSGEIVAVRYGQTQDEKREPYRGFARSTDGGSSFEQIPTEWLGPENFFAFPNGVWIDNTNTIFASAYNRNTGDGLNIYRLESGGMTWEASIPSLGSYPQVYLNFDSRGLLHLLVINDSTYRSRDGGRTWELLPDGPITHYPTIILQDTRRIYRIGNHPSSDPGLETQALFTFEDEGSSWSQLDFFSSSQSVWEVVAGENGDVFSSVEEESIRYLYQSTDGGASWHKVMWEAGGSSLGNNSTSIGGLKLSPEGYLYAWVDHNFYRTLERVGVND